MLLMGSTGIAGREILQALRKNAIAPHCPTRRDGVDALRPETLRNCCDGTDIVVSAMGGSVLLTAPERRPYRITNTLANRNLLAEAKRAGARRFIYVAAHTEPGYRQTAYVHSHEAFVEDLKSSGLAYTVLRPTAIFPALQPFLNFARRGVVPLIGSGFAKTNPISAEDVARAAVEYLSDGPTEFAIGGPEVLTRRGIAELAAEKARRRPVYISAPAFVARANGRITGVFHPRLGELIESAAAVSVTDCIAPAYGTKPLGGYFEALASA